MRKTDRPPLFRVRLVVYRAGLDLREFFGSEGFWWAWAVSRSVGSCSALQEVRLRLLSRLCLGSRIAEGRDGCHRVLLFGHRH